MYPVGDACSASVEILDGIPGEIGMISLDIVERI